MCTSPLSRTCLLLGERGEAKVRLDNLEVWEELLGQLVVHAGVDNHVVTGHPVDRGGDPVLVARLQRVNNTEHLGRVAASGRGIGEYESDGLLGVNDEHRADRESNALGVDVGGILMVQPSTRLCQTCSAVLR